MKTTTYIKEALLKATFFATLLLLVSCTNNQGTEDSKDVAEERNDAKFDDNKQQQDAQFLVNAAEINLEEIQLGQLAQQKGTVTHVKELGKMMEDAHTKSLRDLTALAAKKRITIPTSSTDNGRDLYQKLNEKSGKDFDKAYADMMVNRHKDAIAAFEDAATDSHDADIKNWATTTLPTLRTHMDHSLDCQKKCAER
jgi:putative membrane protein